jgi:hypothetical protein
MRRTNIPDSLLIEHAGTVKKHLEADLADFTAFDSTLDNAKLGQLGLFIKEAKGMDPDRVVRSGISEKTVTIKELMEAGKSDCGKVFYFAEKKFMSKPVIMEEFGQRAFREGRNSQRKLSLYMFQLDKTIGKYRGELISAGAQESLLDNIGIIANMLYTGNLDQEALKKVRPLQTLQRNTKLNDIYTILREFNKASKKVYTGNRLKQAKYLMPKRPRSGGSNKNNEIKE